jgi:hypothetical protein
MLRTNVQWALCGDQSINEVHMIFSPSRKLIIIHVRGRKISIQQKMTKIETFENKVQMNLVM